MVKKINNKIYSNYNLKDFPSNALQVGLIYGNKAQLYQQDSTLGRLNYNKQSSCDPTSMSESNVKFNDSTIPFGCKDGILYTTDGIDFSLPSYSCDYMYYDGNKWTLKCNISAQVPYFLPLNATNNAGQEICPKQKNATDGYGSYNDCVIGTFSNKNSIFPITPELFDIIKSGGLDYTDTNKHVVKFGSGPGNNNSIEDNSILTYLNECNSVGVAYCSNTYSNTLCDDSKYNNTFRIKSIPNSNRAGKQATSYTHDIIILSNTEDKNLQGILEADDENNPTFIKLVPYNGTHNSKNIFTIHNHTTTNFISLIYYNSEKKPYEFQADKGGGGCLEGDITDSNPCNNCESDAWTFFATKCVVNPTDPSYGNPYLFIWQQPPWGLKLISSSNNDPSLAFSKIQILDNKKLNFNWNIFNCDSDGEKKCNNLYAGVLGKGTLSFKVWSGNNLCYGYFN